MPVETCEVVTSGRAAIDVDLLRAGRDDQEQRLAAVEVGDAGASAGAFCFFASAGATAIATLRAAMPRVVRNVDVAHLGDVGRPVASSYARLRNALAPRE